MPKSKIVEMTNADPEFYPTLGPFLAAHDVHKMLGGVPWDEPTKTWLVLKAASGVIGFCAINQGRRRTLLESLYVTAGHEDAAAALVNEAAARYGHDRDLHSTVRHEIAPAHKAAGFHPVKEMANFVTLVRPAAIRDNDPRA
ncbi:hypothetical protein ACWCV5_32715 [Streptomyces tubercidicus]